MKLAATLVLVALAVAAADARRLSAAPSAGDFLTQNADQFRVLLAAANKTGLLDTLANFKGTLLLPFDASGFRDGLPDDLEDQMSGASEVLVPAVKDLLLSHAIPEKFDDFAALVAAGNVTTASGLALRFAGNQALGGRRDVDVIPVAIPAGDATIFLLDGFVEPSAEVNEGDALWSCKCTISFCTVKCTVGPGR